MKYLAYPILLLLLVLTVLELIPVLGWVSSHLGRYQWMFYGMGGYVVMRQVFFRRNVVWVETFAHELSHALVGLIFFRKIHSFHAQEGSGVIYHSGNSHFGGIFITLAPYCLPYFTYLFLLLRIVGASNMLYVFDLLIGVTFAFHLVCFAAQTRPYQTDIQQHGYLLSYLFIATALIFNTTVVLLSIRYGIVNTVTYLFPRYWDGIERVWDMILSLHLF